MDQLFEERTTWHYSWRKNKQPAAWKKEKFGDLKCISKNDLFSKVLLHKTLYSYDKFEIILLRDERNVFWLKMLSEFPFLPFNYSWKNSKKRSLNIYLMILRCQNRFLLQSFPEVTNNPRWRIIYHGSLKISFPQICKIIFRFLATQFC